MKISILHKFKETRPQIVRKRTQYGPIKSKYFFIPDLISNLPKKPCNTELNSV